MPKLFEHYRRFEFSRLVFHNPETSQDTQEVNVESHTPEMTKLSKRVKSLEENYGETAYKKTIQEQVNKLMPQSKDQGKVEHVDQIITDSVERYMKGFEEVKINFVRETKDLERAYAEAEREIERKTKHELSVLKEAIQDAGVLIATEKEALPDIQNKRQTNRHFGDYLKALEDHYFNERLSEGVERDYGEKFREFQWKMGRWTHVELNSIRERNGGKEQYETLKTEIRNRYKTYANFDNNPSNISSIDLEILSNRMRPTEENIRKLEKADPGTPEYEEFIMRLEDERMMKPENWKYTVFTIGRIVIEKAENDGLKKKFIERVSENIQKIDPPNDFKEAKRVFLKHLEKLSESSVRETVVFVDAFKEKIFESIITPEKALEDEGITDKNFIAKVKHEIGLLMNGNFSPERPTDLTLVKFSRANEHQRKNILSNPASKQELFRAIKISTDTEKGYPDYYSKHFSSTTGESKNTAPFRLKALIILGQQNAEIVKNYGLTAELEKTEINVKNIKPPSLKFRPSIGTTPRFRSNLDRGGMNFLDLGLSTMKVMGYLTMALNYKQEVSKIGQGNILLRMSQAGLNVLTNPGFIAGAAATVISYKGEKDPRYLKWFWLSEYEKEDVLVADRLEQLGSKVGRKKRDRLLGNTAEWKVAERLKKDPEKFKKLMETAASERKRNKFTGISPDLLVKEGIIDKEQDADIYHKLNENSTKTRYLFYYEFLSNEKEDVHDVKEHCTGSGFIEEEGIRSKK